MIDAETIEVETNSESIMFTLSHTPGEPLRYTVQDGDNVSLQKGDIRIEVQDISNIEDDRYQGVVRYVEPYGALIDNGIDTGTDITFSHKHIFACY